MAVNQNGDEVVDERLYPDGFRWNDVMDDDRDKAIALLCERLGVEIVRANKTKHGNTEIVLRENGDPTVDVYFVAWFKDGENMGIVLGPSIDLLAMGRAALEMSVSGDYRLMAAKLRLRELGQK